MTNLRWLAIALSLLSRACFAQVASVSDIWTAGGFLEVCGPPATQLSKAQAEALTKVPPSQFMAEMTKQQSNRTIEAVMCLAFVSGLEQGWKEGHEHGVVAAQFPEGWPKDEKKALAALPAKQLQAGRTAMTVDVPCIPGYVNLGIEKDIIVSYIRDQEKKGNFVMGVALTAHIVWLAFQEAFPCPAQAAKTPEPAR